MSQVPTQRVPRLVIMDELVNPRAEMPRINNRLDRQEAERPCKQHSTNPAGYPKAEGVRMLGDLSDDWLN